MAHLWCFSKSENDVHRNSILFLFTFSWNIEFLSCINRLLPLNYFLFCFSEPIVKCFCWEFSREHLLLHCEMICDNTLSPRTVLDWNFKPSNLAFVCVIGYQPLSGLTGSSLYQVSHLTCWNCQQEWLIHKIVLTLSCKHWINCTVAMKSINPAMFSRVLVDPFN